VRLCRIKEKCLKTDLKCVDACLQTDRQTNRQTNVGQNNTSLADVIMTMAPWVPGLDAATPCWVHSCINYHTVQLVAVIFFPDDSTSFMTTCAYDLNVCKKKQWRSMRRWVITPEKNLCCGHVLLPICAL